MQQAGTRAANLVVAIAVCPLAIPLIVIFGLIITLIDHHGPFYREFRPGRDGIPFRCYKLQTLPPSPGGVPLDRALVAARATRLGAFLRNHGIDELPQVWNVLRGDMNMIGPRPMPAGHLTEISRGNSLAARWLGERQTVLPGITGWSQIHQIDTFGGRTVELDLEYLHHPGLRKNVRILLATAAILCAGKARYLRWATDRMITASTGR